MRHPISSRLWDGRGKSGWRIAPLQPSPHGPGQTNPANPGAPRGPGRRGRPKGGGGSPRGARAVRRGPLEARPGPRMAPGRTESRVRPGGRAMHPRAAGQQGPGGSAPGMPPRAAPRLCSRARPHGPRTTTPIIPLAEAAPHLAPQRRAACRDL